MPVRPIRKAVASLSADCTLEPCGADCLLHRVADASRFLPSGSNEAAKVAILEPEGRLLWPIGRGSRSEHHVIGPSPTPAERARLLATLVDHSIPSLMPVTAACECTIATRLMEGSPLIATGMTPAWKRALERERGLPTEPREPVAYAAWRQWMTGLADGLATLHARGLAHNDPFPHNVIVTGAGAIWVDLGDISDSSGARAADVAVFLAFTLVGSLQRCAQYSPTLLRQLGTVFASSAKPDSMRYVHELLAADGHELVEADPGLIRHTFAESVASAASTGDVPLAGAPPLLLKAAIEYFGAFAFVSSERDRMTDLLRAERAKSWLEEYERSRLSVPRGELERVMAEASKANRALAASNGALAARIKSLEGELAAAAAAATPPFAWDPDSVRREQVASGTIVQALGELRGLLTGHAEKADGPESLADVMSRLQALAGTRSWRVAKTLQYVNAEIVQGSDTGRVKAARHLLRRLAGRAPLAGYDAVMQALIHLDRWRSDMIRRVDALARSSNALARQSILHGQDRTPLRPAGPNTDRRTEAVLPRAADLVSIVLPVYNQANYLREAIEGVLHQTYTNWELIVVNDGSSDGFERAIQPFVGDRRVRVLTQPNQRLPSALNNGFAHARGGLLTWTSADNVMLPGQIEGLVKALRDNPRAGLAYSDYEAIDDRGAPLADPSWRHHNRPDGTSIVRLPQAATIENLHDSADNFVGASFLYRADAAAVIGPYDENTFGAEDYDYWLRLHLVTPFVHVPEVLYRYRVHDNTLNAQARSLNLLPNVERVLLNDRERRRALLAGDLADCSGGGHWRATSQYTDLADLEAELVCASALQSESRIAATSHARVRIVDVDLPLRKLDLTTLRSADVILCRDDLVHAWLGRRELPRRVRILRCASSDPAVHHAAAHCAWELRREQQCAPMAAKPPARVHPLQMPRHVMVAIGRWGRGGLEQVVLDLAAGLLRKDVRVTLGVTDDDPPSSLRLAGEQLGAKVVGLSGSPSIAEFAAAEKVDVVNCHHTITGVHELAVRGIPTVYTFHNSYLWFSAEERARWRAAMAMVTGTIAVSRQVAAYAQAHFGIDPRTCSVVANAVDLPGPASLSLESDTQPRAQEFSFLNVANFNRVKSQASLLHAFAGVHKAAPQTRLVMVGNVSDSKYFEDLCGLRAELALDKAALFLEHLPRAEVLSRLSGSQCFVLPSLLEGASISLLEALAMGIPAIASDVGSARDLQHLSGGLVVIPHVVGELEAMDDVGMWAVLRERHPVFEANLASAMLDMVDNHTIYSRRARADAETVAASCRIDTMAERYLQKFAAAMRARPVPEVQPARGSQ